MMTAYRRIKITHIYSSRIKDVSVGPDSLNLTEEKAGNTVEFTDTGEECLNRTPIVQTLKINDQ